MLCSVYIKIKFCSQNLSQYTRFKHGYLNGCIIGLLYYCCYCYYCVALLPLLASAAKAAQSHGTGVDARVPSSIMDIDCFFFPAAMFPPVSATGGNMATQTRTVILIHSQCSVCVCHGLRMSQEECVRLAMLACLEPLLLWRRGGFLEWRGMALSGTDKMGAAHTHTHTHAHSYTPMYKCQCFPQKMS